MTTLRHFLSLLLSQGLRLPLGIVNVALLARLLGPEGIGMWAMVGAVTGILHATLLSWTQSAGLRFGREEWVRAGRLTQTWNSRWPWLLLGALVAVTWLVVQPHTPAGNLLGLPIGWWPILLGAFVNLWLAAETQTLLQIMGRYYALASVPLVATGLTAAYLVALWTRGVSTAPGLVLGGLVSIGFITWFVTWWNAFRSAACTTHWPGKGPLVRLIKYGWPVAPGFLLGWASDWGDHLLVQWYFSSQEVGLFQSAYQTMLVGIGLSVPLATLLLPRLVEASVDEPRAAHRYVTRVFPTMLALWGVLIILVLTALPLAFVVIMGQRFADAVPALSILCVALPGALVAQMYSTLFSLEGRLERTLVFQAAMTSLDLCATVLLLPVLGLRGAAIGTSLSYLAGQYLGLADQHSRLGVSLKPILPLFAGLVAFAVALIAVPPTIEARSLSGLLGLLGFVALVRRLRAVDEAVVGRIFPGRLAALLVRLLAVPGA